MVAAINTLSPLQLRSHLCALARLTTDAAISFEVANDRSSGRFDEARMPTIEAFMAGDRFAQVFAGQCL
jgi:hypothetical protein